MNKIFSLTFAALSVFLITGWTSIHDRPLDLASFKADPEASFNFDACPLVLGVNDKPLQQYKSNGVLRGIVLKATNIASWMEAGLGSETTGPELTLNVQKFYFTVLGLKIIGHISVTIDHQTANGPKTVARVAGRGVTTNWNTTDSDFHDAFSEALQNLKNNMQPHLAAYCDKAG